MPVINLPSQRAAYLNGVAQRSLFLGGDKIWSITIAGLSAVNYFARDGVTYPWYIASTPNAVYDATGDKTWVTYERWDGLERRAALRIYDHATAQWSQTYDLFESALPDDDHGVPALCFDEQGHVHVFGGAHNSAMLWWSTTVPRDPSTFVRRATIGGGSNDGYGYPHPVVSGTTLFLFMRDNKGTGMPLVLRKITGLNNGTGTVGGEFTVAQLANRRCYIGWIARKGSKIVIPIYGSAMTDNERRDVWMLVYDMTTGSVENLSGSVTTAQGSLPITLGATHSVLDQTAAGKYGGFGFIEYDAQGRLHLIYQQGDTAAGTRTLHHMIYSAGAWSAPTQIGTLGNVYNGIAGKFLSDGSLMFLFAKGPSNERGGDIYRLNWTQAGGWSSETLVRAAAVDGFKLDVPNPVLNGKDSLAMVFSEIVSPGSGGASLNDTALGKVLKTFAYGTNGIVMAGGVAPSITAPKVVGTPVVGRVLSVEANVKGEPKPDLTYQWRKGGTAISGATSATYTPVAGDAGASITCEITASSANGTATQTATGLTVQADLTNITASQIAGSAVLMNMDASDASTLTLSGGDVTEWRDKSPSAFPMTVAPSSTAPAYSATGWDGTRPAVTFDGAVAGDMLVANGPLHSYLTIYTVAERIAGVNDVSSYGGLRSFMSVQSAPFDATSTSQSQKTMIAMIAPSGDASQTTFTMLSPSGTQISANGFTVGKKTILRNRIRPENGVLYGIQIGNDAETKSSPSSQNTGAGWAQDNKFYLGGDPQNDGRRGSLKVAQLLIVYGTVTEQQDADIKSVLSAKWGITLS